MMNISIITATHRRPEKLRTRCLDSLLSQTDQQFEWVVVNDGADKATEDVVRSVAGEVNTRYIATPHRGLIASRNRALDEATGDFVAFLDDDNILLPTYLATMRAHLAEHAEMAMALPVRFQRRDIYRDGVCIKRGKQITRPWPEATNEDFVTHSRNAWFDSNGFIHRRDDSLRFNPHLLVMSDYEYLLQCFSIWGLDSMRVCWKELVDYVQTNEGIIGRSSWGDMSRELTYLWQNRANYPVFDAVKPEPWLREQMEEAGAKCAASDDLPGFPREEGAQPRIPGSA
jgi:glycosyltransferase involved in cell wall biosynthesis